MRSMFYIIIGVEIALFVGRDLCNFSGSMLTLIGCLICSYFPHGICEDCENSSAFGNCILISGFKLILLVVLLV